MALLRGVRRRRRRDQLPDEIRGRQLPPCGRASAHAGGDRAGVGGGPGQGQPQTCAIGLAGGRCGAAGAGERAARDAVSPKDIRFSRKDLRDYTGFGDTQAKVHLARLVELEYVFVSRVRHTEQASAYVYELAWSGEGMDGEAFVMGLIDPATLNAAQTDGYDQLRSGVDGARAASGRAEVAPVSAGGREPENPVRALQEKAQVQAASLPPDVAHHRADDIPVAVVPPKAYLNGAAAVA